MSRRQLADEEGHRWDVEDEGPLGESRSHGLASVQPHQLRFTRDDGTERVRAAPHSLDHMADVELRGLLRDEDPARVEFGAAPPRGG